MNSSATPVQAPSKRADIQAAAREYLGVPWRHQGRNLEVGIDCAGLIVMIAKKFNLSEYDSTNYHRNPLNDSFIKHFSEHMIKKKPVERKVGDVLLFRDKMFSCHSAILSEKHGCEHIIHAYAKRKKVVEEPFTDEWKKKMTYCFAFEGVED